MRSDMAKKDDASESQVDRAYRAMFERAEKQAQTYQARIDTQRSAITALQEKISELEAHVEAHHEELVKEMAEPYGPPQEWTCRFHESEESK
jgi:predicted  nucleic acid-binding Zn-ribbon protein